MASAHVPGVAVVLVSHGRVVTARGYGYANLKQHLAVTAHGTLFQIGPACSAVTALAVLTLSAAHRLRLNADVQPYVAGVPIARTFPRPITLAQLLTHTSGLGDSHIGRMASTPEELQPLGRFLTDNLPPRLTPPGAQYAYSTFGLGLAGYAVQADSHVPFAEYVRQHVFRPLGMSHSSFDQRLPSPLTRSLASGYDASGGRGVTPAPRDYFNLAPGQGMVSTGGDMAHFLIAMLAGGRYAGRHVIAPALVRTMLASHFTSYPTDPSLAPMPSVAYGWDREGVAGRQVVEESGVVRGFGALITLLPRFDAGLFIAGNLGEDGYLFRMQRQVINRFFPAPAPLHSLRPFLSARLPLRLFAGSYWSDEYSPNTIEKVRQLINQVVVTPRGRSRLDVRFWTGGSARLTRIAPTLFQDGSGPGATFWAFRLDRRRRVIWMAAGGNTVFDKIPWPEETTTQLVLTAGFAVLFLSATIAWLISLRSELRSRQRRRPPQEPQTAAVRASRPSVSHRQNNHTQGIAGSSRDLLQPAAMSIAGAISLLNLVFLIGFGAAMWSAISTQAQHYSWIEYGIPFWVTVLLTLPLVSTTLLAGLLAVSSAAWIRSRWSIATRLYLSTVAFAGVLFTPFLLFWNLLGYRY